MCAPQARQSFKDLVVRWSESVSIAEIVATEIRTADLFTTRAQLQRIDRVPDLQAELLAALQLSRMLAYDPPGAVRQLLVVACRLCGAGSAGVSLVQFGAGQSILHWEAVSGVLAAHEGRDTPRDFSACGLCLDAGTTIVVSRPEQVFTYLREMPEIVEKLIVPLYGTANALLGTLWLARHDGAAGFCSDDARIVEQLAVQLTLALRLLEQASEQRYAAALVESHQRAQRKLLSHDLTEERRLRQRAEASEEDLRQAVTFRDAVIRDTNHRVKNTLQVAATLLAQHARATQSARAREALLESHERLHVLAKVHEQLCASDDSAQLVFMPSLLQTVAGSLRESFSPVLASVRLRIACDPIALRAEDAMAIALLANEAITNAYKHAFPDGASGEIAVELREIPDDVLLLQIVDSGVGMRSTGARIGFGLKLIRTFAAQLQGTLIFAGLAGGAGTSVTLTMHRDAPVPQATLADPDQATPDPGAMPDQSAPNQSSQWAGSNRSDSFLTTA
jgi:two-component sensor histidine kinase